MQNICFGAENKR